MKFLPWGGVHFTHYLCQAFPDTKYVKNINMKRHFPPVETSHGQVWYYFKYADLWSDVPLSAPLEVSNGQVWYYIEQADPRQRHLVAMCDNICHIDQMYAHPLVQTSHGQVWYFCEQADLQSEVPPT